MKTDIQKAAAALGRIKSEKKSAAAVENGKKGGRPKLQWKVCGRDLKKEVSAESRKDAEKTARKLRGGPNPIRVVSIHPNGTEQTVLTIH